MCVLLNAAKVSRANLGNKNQTSSSGHSSSKCATYWRLMLARWMIFFLVCLELLVNYVGVKKRKTPEKVKVNIGSLTTTAGISRWKKFAPPTIYASVLRAPAAGVGG